MRLIEGKRGWYKSLLPFYAFQPGGNGELALGRVAVDIIPQVGIARV